MYVCITKRLCGGDLLTVLLAEVDPLHLLLYGGHGEAGLGQVRGLQLQPQRLVLLPLTNKSSFKCILLHFLIFEELVVKYEKQIKKN